MKHRKEIIIGIVIVVTMSVLIWGFNFLKGKDIFQRDRNYYAVYDKIGGLVTSSPVLINGFKVGQVRDIHLHPDNSGRIVVNFILETDVRIPVNSVARIFSSDLMGTKSIEIKYSDSKNYYHVGDTLKAETERELKEEVNAQMLPLKNKAESLISTFDSLLSAFESVFTDSVRENLRQSFTNIRITLQNLNRTSKSVDDIVNQQGSRIEEIINDIHEITKAISTNDQSLTNIIRNFSSISDTLAKANISKVLSNVNNTLGSVNDIMSQVNQGKGTLGMLLKDDKLYSNLKNSSSELTRLLKDIRENPRRYLNFSFIRFGKDKKKTDTTSDHSENLMFQNSSFYCVQFMSGKKLISSSSAIFNGLDDVFIYQNNGGFKYLTGYSQDIDSIYALKNRIKLVFPSAFVVAFKNGKQVPVF